MGLLKHLLFWPVTGPSFLTRFSLEKVEGAVRTELTDDSAVKRDLMQLQLELEMGEIDEDEYVAREAELMVRLRQVREWRERFGMATSGGLVRVAEDAGDEAPAHPTGPGGEPGSGADAGQGTESEREDERRPQIARADEAEIDLSLGFDDE